MQFHCKLLLLLIVIGTGLPTVYSDFNSDCPNLFKAQTATDDGYNKYCKIDICGGGVPPADSTSNTGANTAKVAGDIVAVSTIAADLLLTGGTKSMAKAGKSFAPFQTSFQFQKVLMSTTPFFSHNLQAWE
jgi:hypothetical protein